MQLWYTPGYRGVEITVMKRTILLAADGKLVGEIHVPPFRDMPEGIMWGRRFFVPDPEYEGEEDVEYYREGLLWVAPPAVVGWWMAPALAVAGIGGGWVITPNTTMTLRCVPVTMAGSAGGALQTGQRIGGAIGTAALPGVFYAMLAMNGRDYPMAAAIAVAVAVASIVVALGVAVAEWQAGKRRGDTPCGPPEHLPETP